QRWSITVVARPVVELGPREGDSVLVEINNCGVIVPLIPPIELNRVGDDSAYEPQAFFGTVEKEIKKRPLRGRCRQKFQINEFEWPLGKRTQVVAVSALPMPNERVDGEVCQLLRRSLRQSAPELENA